MQHLLGRHAGGLALDPGLRKTSITLEAFCRLQKQGVVRTMLVVAPLKVCRLVWRQEGSKWTQFRHLVFALLHGDKKDAALKSDADVYLINPEGIEWLCKKFFGRSLAEKFDIVTIDELTKFKNSQADRSKALRPRLARVPRRWGLTGSLAPNGFMDLFGQMLILDDGAALGRYITHYRDSYFQLDYDGFTYALMPGAEKRIVQKIAPYWLQMSADDYLQLPQIVPDPRVVDLDTTSRKTYNKMKKDMIAQLPEGIVTAANAAATYSKLAQMANGAVYVGEQRKVALIHDAKLDALEELLEELDGKPLLLAYEFNHDLDRLVERFGTPNKATGRKELPYLGKGTTAKQESEWTAAWNRNDIALFPCHPASAGHGLNLQEGNAGHVCWFGPIWDLELYDQFLRRVRRSGNTAQRIMNHMLIVRDSIDELKVLALEDKDMTQSRLLRALNTEIRRDADTLAASGTAANYRRDDMVMKISRPAVAGQPPAPTAAPAERITPKGWGRAQQTDVEEVAPAQQPQQERIREQIAPESPAPRSAFSRGVQEQANSVGAEAPVPQPTIEAAPPPRRRRAAAAEPQPDQASSSDVTAHMAAMRVGLIQTLISADPQSSVEDLLDAAKALWEWIA